jgi:PDZ domain-containing protein
MLPPSTEPAPPPDLPPPPPGLGDAEPIVSTGRWSRRARRSIWAALIVVVLLASSVLAAAVVRVPYYSFSPGVLHDASGVIEIEGVPVYPLDGEISFTTVSIRGRLTVLRYLADSLNPDAEVVPERAVLGDRDRDENRQLNFQLMDMSTQTATYVALTRLGYEVGRTGSGAIVVLVEEGEAADGIIDPGDTIVAVNGNPIAVTEDLVEHISDQPPGTRVVLSINPLGTTDVDEREVVLGARDDDPTKGFLGVRPQTRDLQYRFPVDVHFNTGRIGGPSAGLAFTLTLLDLLSEGSLTGGLHVAATGTIDEDGNVGPIGGLEFKSIVARRAGYDVFLVPAATAEEDLEAAYRRAGDSLLIIEVDTLEDALDALVELGGDPLPVAAT